MNQFFKMKKVIFFSFLRVIFCTELKVRPELDLKEDDAIFLVERPDHDLLADLLGQTLKGVRAVDELLDGHRAIAHPEAVVAVKAEARCNPEVLW